MRITIELKSIEEFQQLLSLGKLPSDRLPDIENIEALPVVIKTPEQVHKNLKRRYFTREEVKEIVKLKKEGLSNAEIGDKFGVNPASIYMVWYRQKQEDGDTDHKITTDTKFHCQNPNCPDANELFDISKAFRDGSYLFCTIICREKFKTNQFNLNPLQ